MKAVIVLFTLFIGVAFSETSITDGSKFPFLQECLRHRWLQGAKVLKSDNTIDANELFSGNKTLKPEKLTEIYNTCKPILDSGTDAECAFAECLWKERVIDYLI